MGQQFVMIPKEDFAKEIASLVNQEVKKSMLTHLEKYDEFAQWPSFMSLKEAEKLSGIKVSSIKYHASKGNVTLSKANTGSKYSRSKISKKELMKLLIAQDT